MNGDFKPIIWDLPAKQDITIYPIADLHYGAKEFMGKEWKEFVDRIQQEKNSYIVIVGDMINNALKSSVSNIYEETCRPSEQKRWIADQLKPIKEKIICGVGGNHERRSLREADDNPLYDIFSKLDIEDRFRENMAFSIVRIGASDRSVNGALRPTYTICATHGNGGGMYIGSSANKTERFGMAIDGIDIFITGHTHKPLTFPASKLVVDAKNKKVSLKQFKVVVATSWMTYGGYPAEKMMPPVAHELAEIKLSSIGKSVRVLQ